MEWARWIFAWIKIINRKIKKKETTGSDFLCIENRDSKNFVTLEC